MNNVILGISLLLVSTACLAQGDIWNNLFREKLREANQGSLEAQYDVGSMYLNGRGVQASRETAVEWFSKAAARQYPQAITRLKLMSENETRFNKTRTEAGQGNPGSQYELGNMYIKGIGTNVDYTRAISAYEQSAGRGFSKAAYKLGLIYYEGTGVPVNMKTAFGWFRKAATDNHAAQYYLGKMYADGQGTARDNALALEWLSKAVDGGFDQARGAMIDVSERIAMESAAQAAETRAAATKPAPARVTSAARTSSRSEKKKPRGKRWDIEDLMLAAWYRDNEPVTYLPSLISNCRIENDRLVCLSDDQTRRTGANLIKYKTKALIENFNDKGTFEVTYRNLVIDASRVGSADAGETTPGNDSEQAAYTVKTGWGTPHVLECRFKNSGTLSCVKNKSYHFELTSPRALTAGK